MPEIFHRQNSNVSIRQALSRGRLELLPEEIRVDSLARWVMDFDDLRSRDRYERPYKEDPDSYATWALDLVVIGALQRQIPFYFATLFQIGRQWKVSESAMASIESASSQENLRATAELNRHSVDRPRRERSVGKLYERSERDATEALSALLGSARAQHMSYLREARQWWTSWREEVGSIRTRVDRLQEIGHRRPDPMLWSEVSQFLVKSYRPSLLRQTLEASGVRFAGEAAPTPGFSWAGSYLEVLTPLLFLGLSLGGSRSPFIEHFFFEEWRHILHDLRSEAENGEARRVGLERLVRKYSMSEDPFEPYLPLRKPASEALRNFVIEHTLQGNQPSPWLSTWRRCIEFNSATTLKVPLKKLEDRENVSAFARGADCAIKQSLPGELRPGETLNEFIQRLFETGWVLKLAGQLVLNESNAKTWRFESFAALVAAVASALNDVGYRLDVPSQDRLQKLWDRLQGEAPWSVDEW
jgi:hypothetical protein